MGLAAFVVFVVPWVLLAVWLTRTPTALRLGAPAAPWRVIPTHRDLARAQRYDSKPHSARTGAASKAAGGDSGKSSGTSGGGSLHGSVEPTEPTA